MAIETRQQKFVQKQRTNTLMQMAYNELRESIINNTIQPGDVLSEQQIAEQLNISRTPVREALAILESEGLIEVRRGIGAFVKPMSYKDISDIYEVRGPLEALAFQTAVYHVTPEEIQALRQRFNDILVRYERRERIEIDEFYQVDAAFHDLIVERCENPYVQRFMSTINSNSHRMLRMFSNNMQSNLKEAIQQHLRLLELLEAQDVKTLEVELSEQLRMSKQRYTQI